MSMEENPYRAPKADLRATGIKSGRREDLKGVAQTQKVLLFCILAYIVVVLFIQFAQNSNLIMIAAVLYLVIAVVALVFVFKLAMKVYSIGVGVLMGILTIVPCIGMIVLLVVNQKATTILKENGYRVGLLGADMSQF